MTPLPAFSVRSAPSAEAAPHAKLPVKIKNLPPKANQTEQKARWRDGEILVRFREHAPVSKLNQLLSKSGAQWNGQLRGESRIERLRLSEGLDPEAVAATLRTSEFVDFAEPNYLITADQTTTQTETATEAVPDDPRYPEQAALKHTVSSKAWGVTTGSKQTVIAVLDSGIDFTHPDLKANEWNNSLEQDNNLDNDQNGFNSDLHGWDFINNSDGIIDGQGHGTSIAGIIAAQGNNRIGITGVMWQAGLMSLRVLDNTGTGDIAHAVEAIDYAVDNGAQVINCSWGTDDSSSALQEAINRAAGRGVIVITSAGNSGHDVETTPHYPASFDLPNLISVASTDNKDQLSAFSNWGMTHVSIAAPGTDIMTTKLGGDYQTVSGTSASTAFVAGVAGLVKTLRPWLGADRTRELILRGARPVPTLSDKVAAKGIVNAAGALEAINTLPANEGLNETSGYNGGEHGNNGEGRSSQRAGRPGAINNSRSHDGHEFAVAPLQRTQGVPGMGLPNLDELRRQQPVSPKAAPPVPSTRCSHLDPQCNRIKRQAGIDQVPDLLAWGLNLPSIETAHGNRSLAVSDSPFKLGLIPQPLLAALSPQPQPQTTRTNVALASNGSVATASSTYSTSYPASAAINGDRKGTPPSSGGLWHSASPGNTFPDWLQVDFNGNKTIDEIDVFTLQDNYSSPSEPTSTMTFSLYGLTSFEVQYWNGSIWVDVTAGNVTGNNKVWRSFSFTPITTSKIRVQTHASVDGYSRITELEAYGTDAVRTNVAISTAGAVASASSYYTPGPYTANKANNGDRKGTGGEMWHSPSPGNTFPDWLQIDFNGSKTIDEVDVFTIQDNYSSPSEPTEAMTFSLYGLTGYEVQYWNGSAWVDVPGGSVTGNNKVWRRFYFSPLTTTKIRVLTNASVDGYSRIPEVEAYGTDVQPRVNVALSANGSAATASSTYQYYSFPPSAAINGEHKGLDYFNNGTWHSGAQTFPQWLQVDFNGSKTIDEIDVYTVQDNYTSPSEPTTTMTFSLYGLTGYDVQYWNGSAWVTIPNGSVTGNNKVWRQFTFSPVTTTKIRVLTGSSVDGWSRITELEAWGTSAAGSSSDPSGNNYSTARIDPTNRTGSGGVDLLSGNATWSLPILGLKGRAGLDLGLSLSYNSLVWTKDAGSGSIKFDTDLGNPSPGFRLGFPVIQPPYYNSQTGKNAYLLITPSGSHVELRATATANTYESADSSYLQLKANGDGSLTLKPTDGSQLTYVLYNGQYQCTQIKDRNGNFVSVSYYTDGRIDTVTDTLGRVITFTYDAYLNLNKITQSWGGSTPHDWATFGWSNQAINTSFSGLTVVGPQNGISIPVLTQVNLGDGTHYGFDYNSYGQVTTLHRYAADNHQLSYTSYTHTLPLDGDDCPRVSQQKDYAENWNSNLEATTSYVQATDHSSGQVTMPDNATSYKEVFATTGWQKGLTTGTRFYATAADLQSDSPKKWTTTTYTQDDTNLSYQKNPRVTETNIYDLEGNHKKTTIDYGSGSGPGSGQYAQYGLPYLVTEYAADATTPLRYTYTDYNLDSSYLNNRIIGLVSAVHVSNGSAWQSKTVYAYDTGTDQLQATTSAPSQHDTAYGTAFTARGNITAVSRYDVTDISNDSKALTTHIGYDTDGSVVFTRDPLWQSNQAGHQANISYTDDFSVGTPTNPTFAYQTKITPPTGTGETAADFASTSKYNYYFGAVTETKGALPAGQTVKPEQTMEYDTAGRLTKVNNIVTGAWKLWAYPTQSNAVQTQTTITSTTSTYYEVTVFDGAGRVRAQGGDLPDSTGLYRGQFTYYDVMGRASQTTNPSEMTSVWAPAGLDAAGWVWTQQAYDWKGRPTVTTLPSIDGGVTSATREMTYGGCGCAGGEVVTVKDEVGRRQRMTADVLGRAWKSEVLDWDGTTIYSTTTNNYNARDQITSTVEQVGSSGTSQTTSMTYDGYGRLLTTHAPQQQDQSNQPLSTTYSYNKDDSTNTVTDARGVVSTFSYNNRHQVTGISYSNVPTNVAATTAVSFSYDAAGNRTGMTDGSGSVTYNYDQLSRLTSEIRHFSGLSSSSSSTLSYSYNLGGELTSITDPDSKVVNYSYDLTGRMTGITGTSFAGVTTYASNLKYRAWGAIMEASFGDSTTLSESYNPRLMPTAFSVSTLIVKHYEYNADGRLRYSKDNSGNRFDRSYTYDHVGRVTAAFSGPEARGEADTDVRPYHLIFSHDAMNHLTSRNGRLWSMPGPSEARSYSSERNIYWSYDADGRLTNSQETQYSYDAAGRAVGVIGEDGDLTQTQLFDGNGTRTMLDSQRAIHHDSGPDTTETVKQYFVTSSVLNQVVTELDESGNKTRTFVYQGDQILAWQQKNGTTETMAWEHRDISNASVKTPGAAEGEGAAELDPLGMNAGVINPFPLPSTRPPLVEDHTYPVFSRAENLECSMYGVSAPCVDATGFDIARNHGGGSSSSNMATQVGFHWFGPDMIPGRVPIDFAWDFLGWIISQGKDVTEENIYDLDREYEQELKQHFIPLGDIAKNVAARLTGDCGTFVNDLYKKVAGKFPKNESHSKDLNLLEVFNIINSRDGAIVLVDNLMANGEPAGGTVRGAIGHPTYPPTIYIAVSKGNTPVSISSAQQYRYPIDVIHETFHLAATNGGYTDEQMARAVYDLTGKPGLPKDGAPVHDWSRYWGDVLEDKCREKK